jgi:hypothetical protein
MLALRRGEAARTLELLDTVSLYDHSPDAELWAGICPWSGAPSVESGTRRRGAVPHHPESSRRGSGVGPLSAGAARPRPRRDVEHETAQARKEYEGFMARWSRADSGLRPLTEARTELGTLASEKTH